LRVADIMRRKVVAVRPELPVTDLEALLVRERVAGVPVVEAGRVVGVVSRSDVVRQLEVERAQLGAASAFYLEPWDVEQRGAEDAGRVPHAVAERFEHLHVRDVMIRDVIQVAPDATLRDAARRMAESRVHRVLVTEGGALVGILSALDLVRLLAEGALVERGT
jgi:CBS domain-containing protein